MGVFSIPGAATGIVSLLRKDNSGRRLGKVEMQAFLFRSAPTESTPLVLHPGRR